MSIDIATPQDTRLGGFGHSADEDARHRGTQFDPAVVDAMLALEARDDVAAAA
jgi:hypothetical protein